MFINTDFVFVNYMTRYSVASAGMRAARAVSDSVGCIMTYEANMSCIMRKAEWFAVVMVTLLKLVYYSKNSIILTLKIIL